MKILILGANGNLGSQLVKVFKDKYDVTAWDMQNLDIANKKSVKEKIGELSPDVVINSVGITNVDTCESSDGYKLAKKINGDAVGYLADACIDIGAIFVHYSTDYIFDGEKKIYAEDDKPNPINKYGETKFFGEKEILKRKNKNLKWYLIRTSRLFGLVGTSKTSKPSFFNKMLAIYAKATAKGEKTLKVVDENVACFTYSYDLADETRKIIENSEANGGKIKYGIYHIVNSGPCTWYEAAVELFKISNIDVDIKPVTREEFPAVADRLSYSVLKNTKLPKLRNWRDALREYVKK